MHSGEPDPQAESIAFLSRAESHGGIGPVDQVETHISRVFLVGNRALKLKKAVRFSYLDYSTAGQRQAACLAELAVNRRFAPSLYLGVVPIARRPDGGLELDGTGPPVDWVIRMHRFDQSAQLDRVAARGELTDQLARDLADRIALLHQGAAASADHGGAAGLGRALDITIENLRLGADPGTDPALALQRPAVEAWYADAAAALGQHAPRLEARREAGRVRACHGDLHLRNICLLDGEPTLFDAIEFDPALSTIDVLYDLAFLLMDLGARGLAGAANAVFNRYLDRRCEADGLPALPLFMSLRAAIRAQVTIAAARGAPPGTAGEAVAEAQRYLALARDLLAPASPRLVAIGGLSGAGKSTLAYRLAPALGRPPGARIVRSDVLRKRAAGMPPERRLPAHAYTPDSHQAVYRMLVQEAGTCLAAGCCVIADAVFGAAPERDAIAGLARTAHVPFQGLWLDAPLAERVARVAARAADASDATVDVVRAQHDSVGIPQAPAEGWLRVPADRDPDATLRAAATILSGRGAAG